MSRAIIEIRGAVAETLLSWAMRVMHPSDRNKSLILYYVTGYFRSSMELSGATQAQKNTADAALKDIHSRIIEGGQSPERLRVL